MPVSGPAYTANGLNSGLNDSAIIQALVSIRAQPINQLQAQEGTLQTQISDLGKIASDLATLQSAVDALASGGTVASKVTSTNTGFTAIAGTQATAGQYTVQVTGLASAAKARSAAFASANAAVVGGTLNLSVQGQNYAVTISDGQSLSSVAQAINQLGAPVNATVLSDGTHSYLELSNSRTGYPLGADAASALTVSEDTTGSQGQALGLAVFQQATNASLTVDGLPIQETSNAVTDAIPGVTLNLAATTSAAENLVVATDASGTAQNLQTFLSAYNSVNADLQAQLAPPPVLKADGSTSAAPAPLSGDASILGLQQQLQQLLTATVSGVAGFNSLASLGITSARDGSLSIDQSLFSAAVNANPNAVNALFANAQSGIAASLDSLVGGFTAPSSGVLSQEQQNLTNQLHTVTKSVSDQQLQLTAYQANLQQQYAEMEQLVGTAKSVGNYITQLSGLQTASHN